MTAEEARDKYDVVSGTFNKTPNIVTNLVLFNKNIIVEMIDGN